MADPCASSSYKSLITRPLLGFKRSSYFTTFPAIALFSVSNLSSISSPVHFRSAFICCLRSCSRQLVAVWIYTLFRFLETIRFFRGIFHVLHRSNPETYSLGDCCCLYNGWVLLLTAFPGFCGS